MNEHPLFEPLSRREREILALLCENLRDQEIAERLFLALPTVKWYNRQIFDKLGVNKRREACKSAKASGLLAQNGVAEPAPVKHNLPSQLTPFVGRSRELAEIDGWLAHPHTRLLTILAPGGMGKTRLALEAAERSLSRYADGVFFAPLAALTSTDHVVPALAEALGLQFTLDGRTPEQQLSDFLRRKHLLLVLDNFEHLLDAAPLIAELLTAAPKVTALITSRERLNLNGETVYPLAGLHYPEADEDDPLRFGAAQLFVECAMRANPHFVTNDAAAIGRLCRRVQGMPLAIELAAALSGALSVDEIDAEIARSADFLQTNMSNIPERQRSVRAVFEAAWARLAADARRAFRRMSVFRGGCTREAAQAVTGADIRTLAALVDKALLWRNPETSRYDIHELLRQYAEAELESAGEIEDIRQAHQEYFAEIAWKHGVGLIDDSMTQALAVLDAELDNVRHAFARALATAAPRAIKPFTHVTNYYRMRGNDREALRAIQAAIAVLEPDDSVALANSLSYYSNMNAMLGRVHDAHEIARRAVEMARRLGAREMLPHTLMAYGDSLNFMGDQGGSTIIYQDVIALSKEIRQPFWISPACFQLALHACAEGRHEEATAMLLEGYTNAAKLNNFWAMSFCLNGRAHQAFIMGELDEARRLFTEELDMARRNGFQLHVQLAMHGLGIILRQQRDWLAVRATAQDSLRLQYKIGSPDGVIAITTTLLAEAELFLGDSVAALHRLRETLTLLDKQLERINFGYWFDVAGQFLVHIGDVARAATLLSVPVNRHPDRYSYFSLEMELLGKGLEECREALSPEEFEAAWERGQTLTNEEAIALVAEALR